TTATKALNAEPPDHRDNCIYGISPDGEIAIMSTALAAQASSPDGRAAARASSPEGPRGRGLARAARSPAGTALWPGRPADAWGGFGHWVSD
ncbi:MAG: hypothetical protein ACJA2W_002387, partial [Planctomycetota bacterium]